MENTLTEKQIDDLIKTAKLYRERSYSPYSNLKVGAALLTNSGNVYGGCNVESVSFGLTMCAERTAIFKAVSEGERDFQAIALVLDEHHYGSPCGACRQVLREFGTDITIIMATAGGEYIVKGLDEILPFSFGSELSGLIGAGAGRVGVPYEAKLKYSKEIASMIDHTLLKPDATKEQITKLCDEAMQYGFASVCVNPTWVKACATQMKDSQAMVCTVIGFPLGASTPKMKAEETKEAIVNGADEIDMVINIGALKAGDHKTVEEDIRGVVEAAKGHTVKVILETGLLNDEMKIAACEMAKRAGAHFVKTSTGFTGKGATADDIALMRKTVGPGMGVKASGGVRDLDQVKKLMKVGATRIGASASIAIVKGEKSDSDY